MKWERNEGPGRWLTVLVLAWCVLVFAPRACAQAAEGDVRRDATVLAVEKVMPTVVNIATATIIQVRDPFEEIFRQFWGPYYRRQPPNSQYSLGSGVVIDEAGYLLTNDHVVRRADKIGVKFCTGTNDYSATVVASDPKSDVALLKLDAPPGEKFKAIQFAHEDDLLLGETVLALGNPFGLGGSVTRGILSSKSRVLPKEDEPLDIPNWLQTDAPINPGNSGGPLLDIAGHIAGINTMIMSQSGGSEGIGFAIPSNIVQRTYEGLRKNGRIRRGEIGVIPQDITPTLASALGLDRDSGIILSDIVPHGAAEASGLEPGDIVLAVDDKPIEQSRQLMAVVFQHVFGEEITLDIQRGKERLQKTVAVLARPSSPEDLEELASRDAHLIRRLGVLALTLDERVTPILPDLRRLSGVVVAAIPAEFAGLNPGLIAGDAIYELNASRIGTLEELRTALDAKKTGDPIALLIERSGQLVYVSFELE